jgi:dipeptidyl aminopeptidase/acylaminoacyl peptidase
MANKIINFTIYGTIFIICILVSILFLGDNIEKDIDKNETENMNESNRFINKLISMSHNDTVVNAYVNKYEYLSNNEEVNVILAYHGTAMVNSEINHAAIGIATNIREKILNNEGKNIVIISVAYPEENLLIGDNIKEAEAALLWVKDNAINKLQLNIHKIFLFGHSQGAYLVTRLNTMHETDGVISNSPGPLNLVMRCEAEEQRTKYYLNPPDPLEIGYVCYLLYQEYGTTKENPNAYKQRSGMSFVSGYKSDILFIQGMDDGNPFQQSNWPTFIKAVENNENEIKYEFLNIEGFGHPAVFESPEAKQKVIEFIEK